MVIFSRTRTIALSIVCLIFTTQISAQAIIEEIVVTAQKRAESLQEVPISIQAFTGDNLHAMGVSSAEEVLRMIPGGGVIPQGGSKQNFFIRGVGTQDFHLNVVGAVGVYLDDVAINSPNAVSFSTFDTERVEILRGPQNTLFGRNTTGGAVNYVSRKPSLEDDNNGYLRVGYGKDNQFDAEGAYGFKLSENVAARISLLHKSRSGRFNNITTGEDEGTVDRQALRGQLLWEPNADWEILFSYRYGRSRGQPDPYKALGTLDPNDLTSPCAIPRDTLIHENTPLCSDSLGNTFQYSDWEEVSGGTPFKESINTYGGTLRVSWDVGFATITSTSAYDSNKVIFGEDSDSAPTVAFQFYQDGQYDQYSEELRFVSPDDQAFRWMAGFYYFFEQSKNGTVVRRTPAPLAPSGPGLFNILPNTQVDQDNEVFSGYAQVEYDIQEKLTGTVGFRWTKETKTGYNYPSVRCVGTGGPPFCPPLQENASFTRELLLAQPALFLPPTEILDSNNKEYGLRVALDYQMSEDALLYASVSRGFKGGGFSIAALQALLGLAGQAVEPEVLWAYEGGFKTNWQGGALQVNGSVYYYDWKNLQTFQPLLDPTIGIAVPQLLNVPASSMIGGELEIQWAFGEGWYLAAGINVNDAQFDNVGNIATATVGNPLINNPDFSHTGLLRKEIQMANGVLSLQTNWRYKGDHTYDLANSPALSQTGYWNLAARASYSFGQNDDYSVSVWGDNLTGEEYCRGKTSLEGLTEALLCIQNFSEPTFGVTAQYNFN